MGIRVQDIPENAPYKEETIKVPVVLAVLLVVLIAVPLVLWIIRINEAGTRAASGARYDALIAEVNQGIRTVNAFLTDNEEELAAIRAARERSVVTLVVPEVVMMEEQQNRTIPPLDVELKGIYWRAREPLAGINGELYGVGDVIQGYEIVQIDELSVRFRGPDGTLVVKEIYDGPFNNRN
ncbi:hypothetical protein EGM51_01355 [Verrucomicrobia bacterium S94]|nr:hypothetical protein EGM51_01355 [Verrucomicrobia bacterium S94]